MGIYIMMSALALITGFIVLVSAAKRRARVKRDWFRIPVDVVEALSTLADSAGLLQSLTTAALEHDARVTSVELTYAITGLTAGESPIEVFLCASDYTQTEVEEYIELAGLLGPGNKVEKEVSSRFVRLIGAFNGEGTDDVLNDGRPMKTRLNWLVPDGRTINLESYNHSGAQLTTGAVVRVMGHINGFWQY